MKTKKLLVAMSLASCMSYAQSPIIFNVAGTGTLGYSGNGGFATLAKLSGPEAVTVDGNGVIYIADNGNSVIRKISKTGIITTVAGNGTAGFSGDGGAATSAQLDSPSGVVIDGSGNLYIADTHNQRIRKVTSGGTISTIAGNGTAGHLNGSPGMVNYPNDLAIDGSGNLYIADSQNHQIRKWDATNGLSDFAGIAGSWGNSGDGGAATAAHLNTPEGVAVDGSGNVYIADKANNRVRKVSSGTINNFAGSASATSGYSGNGGQATAALLSSPEAVSVDGSGNVYIADEANFVVRKVNTSNVISLFAGTHTQGYSGDGGLATLANMDVDYGIWATSSGDVFLTDYQNNHVREVSVNCPANAGPNQTNTTDCCTNAWLTVGIGTPAVTNMNYSWSPTTQLTGGTTAQPTSAYSNTTTCIVYTVTVSYSLCTTSTSTVQVCASKYTGPSCCRMSNTVAFKEISAFELFPNPSNSTVELTLYAKADYIRVMDINGRLVFEANEVDDTEYMLDVSKFDSGVYFITAKLGDTVEQRKLIRQ